jgi:hypothetical protein
MGWGGERGCGDLGSCSDGKNAGQRTREKMELGRVLEGESVAYEVRLDWIRGFPLYKCASRYLPSIESHQANRRSRCKGFI